MDISQSWIVLSIVGEFLPGPSVRLWLRDSPSAPSAFDPSSLGVCIGVNAAVISIVTEWLSDIKFGYCSDGWWLNEQFCCWEIEGEEVDGCDSWHPWSHIMLGRWFVFVMFAVRAFFVL